MPTDTMSSALPERKRKHKTKTKEKERSPSKKPRHAVSTSSSLPSTPTPKQSNKQRISVTTQETLESDPGSPFRLITATLYSPLSPISISTTHAKASLITEHLSPLLLTYYPPFKGVVMAFSNEWISSTPPRSAEAAQANTNNGPTMALTANEYGVLYLYLTATFLVFSPQKGQVLEGWVNVQSENFLGAITYNLFSVGIDRKRIHRSWKWVPPGSDDDAAGTASKNLKKTHGDDSEFDPEKEYFTPLPKAAIRNPTPTDDTPEDEQEAEAEAAEEDDDLDVMGYFQSASGHRVNGTIRFRVRDVDVIPGADPDRGFLSIDGTMLTPEEEAQLVEEERSGLLPQARRRDPVAMSGGVSQPSLAQNGVAGGLTEQQQQTPTTTEEMELEEKKMERKERKKKRKDRQKEEWKEKKDKLNSKA